MPIDFKSRSPFNDDTKRRPVYDSEQMLTSQASHLRNVILSASTLLNSKVGPDTHALGSPASTKPTKVVC